MKKLLMLFILVIPCLTYAKPNTSSKKMTDKQLAEAICQKQGELAEYIMIGRQNGDSAIDAMKKNDELYSELHNDLLYAIIKKFIIDAYNEPQYATEKYQRRVVNEFSSQKYIECIKNNHY